MDRLTSLLHKLFEEYKFVRRALLVWIVYEINRTLDVFLAVFSKHPTLPGGSTVLIAIIGLLSVGIGLYQWDRARDDK